MIGYLEGKTTLASARDASLFGGIRRKLMELSREVLLQRRVRGLRDFDWGGPVKVMDARTRIIKRILEHPLTYEDILYAGSPVALKIKENKDGSRKESTLQGQC